VSSAPLLRCVRLPAGLPSLRWAAGAVGVTIKMAGFSSATEPTSDDVPKGVPARSTGDAEGSRGDDAPMGGDGGGRGRACGTGSPLGLRYSPTVTRVGAELACFAREKETKADRS